MKAPRNRHRWSWLYARKENNDYPLWQQVLAWGFAGLLMVIVGLFLISLVLDAIK